MKKFFGKFCLALIIFCNFFSVGECKNFVFVVDSSQVMQTIDPQNRVNDALLWATENLSADDEFAVVSFKDVPQTLKTLGKNDSIPFKFNYSGLSNAGAAVLSAVDILTPRYSTDRVIIFIGSGGMSLGDGEKNLQSLKNFENALEQAKWTEIPVYILKLRNGNVALNQYSFPELAKEIPIPHGELMTTLRTIFHDDFNAPGLNLFSKILAEKNLSIDLPMIAADDVKLFLISSAPGTVDLKNVSSKKIQGRFVNVFKIDSPQTSQLNFNLNYPAKTALTLDAVFSVSGNFSAEIQKDTLEITVSDKTNSKIFSDNFFEGKNIRLKINDEIKTAQIENGIIKMSVEDYDGRVSLQKVFFSDLGIIWNGESKAELSHVQQNYFVWILAIFAIALILFLAYRSRIKDTSEEEIFSDPAEKKISEKKSPLPEIKKAAPKVLKLPDAIRPSEDSEKYSYAGKLMLYVTTANREEEIPPQEFSLFRLNQKSINLSEILRFCGIEEDFTDLEKIFIKPSRRGIFVENNSDCTIIKRGNIIGRGSKIELFYDDSINISTETEAMEIVLMYKSLKPN